MGLRRTHTFTVLQVSRRTFEDIKRRLLDVDMLDEYTVETDSRTFIVFGSVGLEIEPDPQGSSPTPTFRNPILVQPGEFPKADHHQAPYDALPNGDAFCRGCGSTVGLDGIVYHLWNCPVAAAEAAAGSTHFAPWDHGQEPPLTAP